MPQFDAACKFYAHVSKGKMVKVSSHLTVSQKDIGTSGVKLKQQTARVFPQNQYNHGLTRAPCCYFSH